MVLGLLLLAGAAGIWFAMKSADDKGGEVAEVPSDAGVIERSTALAEPELVIPDPEPDAGPQDAGQPRKRVVYRYVRGNWDCSGSIPAAEAQRVIAENRRQVRNCYERQLKTNHSLQGSVSLNLKIGRDGRVAGTQVGGSLRDPAVFSCVRNLAQQWRFPAPTGGSCAVLAAPFSFTPRE